VRAPSPARRPAGSIAQATLPPPDRPRLAAARRPPRFWLGTLALAAALMGALTGALAGALAGDDPLAVPIRLQSQAGLVTLDPIPTPDLSRAEAVVRQHLGEARANLAKTLAQAQVPPGVPDTDLAAAYGQTGGYYLAHKLWLAAEACYVNAERLDPRNPRWPYYLGYRYQQDAQPELAAAAYGRALALDPQMGPAQLRLGLVYLDLNRLDQATPLLTAAAEVPGLHGAAHYALGRAAQARQDAAAAVPLFERALTEDPDASQIHYSLAMAYRALGRVEEAKAELAKRGDGEPRVRDPLVDDLAQLLSGARTFHYRGIEALRDGHFDIAADAFRQALAIEPDNVNARVTLARALYLSDDPQGAAEQLQDALGRNPRHPLGLYLLGALREEQGDEAGALDLYRRALAADPQHAGTHHALGNILMRQGDYRQAAEHYAAARAAVPQNAPAALMQALALVRLGPEHQGEARQVLEAALGDQPDDVTLRMALARLLAASPSQEVRDGPRALALAQGLFDASNTLENAETLAMAQAETGDYGGAAALQNNALLATAAAGRMPDLPRLQANLSLYQAGEPCRTPWPGDDPAFYPPPLPARGPMQEYPTREAY